MKKLTVNILVVLTVLLTSACAKQGGLGAGSDSALSGGAGSAELNSSPQALAATQNTAPTSDSGTIAGPTTNTNPDGGVIAGPSSPSAPSVPSTPSAPSVPSTPVVSNPTPVVPSVPSTPSVPPVASIPSTPVVTPPVSTPTPSVPSAPVTGSTGSSDSGSVAGPSAPTGGDTGNIGHGGTVPVVPPSTPVTPPVAVVPPSVPPSIPVPVTPPVSQPPVVVVTPPSTPVVPPVVTPPVVVPPSVPVASGGTPGANDGGVISPTVPPTGNDHGNLPPVVVVTPPSTPVTPPVTPTPGSTPGSTPPSTPSNPGSGSTASNTPPATPPVTPATPGTTPPATPSVPGQPSGNDSGNIANNGNHGQDGGNTNPPANGGNGNTQPPATPVTPKPPINAGTGSTIGTIIDHIITGIGNLIHGGGNNSNPSPNGSPSTGPTNGHPLGNDSGNIASNPPSSGDHGNVGGNTPSTPDQGSNGNHPGGNSSGGSPQANNGGSNHDGGDNHNGGNSSGGSPQANNGGSNHSGGDNHNGGNSSGGSPQVNNGGSNHTGGNPQPGGSCGGSPSSPSNPTAQNTPPVSPPAPSSFKVTLGRACSQYRSQIPYPQFIFFEEAKHPILSFEAMSQAEYNRCYNTEQGLANLDDNLPSTYCNSGSNSVVLKTIDLSNVNLQTAAFIANVSLDYSQVGSNTMVAVTVCEDTVGDGRCSNKPLADILSVLAPSLTVGHTAHNMEVDVWAGRNNSQDDGSGACDVEYSPLVVDLTGQGFLFTAPEDGVYFDINATGSPVATGWTDPKATNNGFLVHQVSYASGISSGAQLFGTATQLKNGMRAKNGFEALKDLDDNGDGQFTKADSEWKNVSVWIDSNHNGQLDSKELYSLDKLGIVSFNLNYKVTKKTDQYGNQIRDYSNYKRRVGNAILAMPIVDVWFNTLVSKP